MKDELQKAINSAWTNGTVHDFKLALNLAEDRIKELKYQIEVGTQYAADYSDLKDRIHTLEEAMRKSLNKLEDITSNNHSVIVVSIIKILQTALEEDKE